MENLNAVEVAELEVCQLCLRPIDPTDPSDYFLPCPRPAPICRGCAEVLLKSGELVVGVRK